MSNCHHILNLLVNIRDSNKVTKTRIYDKEIERRIQSCCNEVKTGYQVNEVDNFKDGYSMTKLKGKNGTM